jgi:flagellar basal body-associated protein FliL
MANEPADTGEAKAAAPAAEPSGQGGFKAWLPLLLTLLIMPGVAYAMTMFVLLPKLQHALGGDTVHAREAGGEGAEPAAPSEKSHAKEAGKPKTKVPLSKIVVNVSGSLGTRLLLCSFTLAGNSNDFKTKIEDNNDQLRDLASSVLASKTIADLEKPEARNLIRAEVLSQFNSALGQGAVQEIYITEFAIQ